MVRKWNAQLKLKKYRMVFLVLVPKYLFPSLGTWRGEPLSRVLFLKDRANNMITVLATVGALWPLTLVMLRSVRSMY